MLCMTHCYGLHASTTHFVVRGAVIYFSAKNHYEKQRMLVFAFLLVTVFVGLLATLNGADKASTRFSLKLTVPVKESNFPPILFLW